MPLPVSVSFASPDPNVCPANVTSLVAYLNTLFTASVTGSYVPFVIGAGTPGVDDQDKLWFKLDAANGQPLGFYRYYSGNWRKSYSGLKGEMRIFNGDPALYFAVGGLGIIGGEWDGWHIANGADGTVNLSDRFIVVAKQDDLGVGYAGGLWKTNISGAPQSTGGETQFQLDATYTYIPPRAAVTVGRWTAQGNTPNGGAGLFGFGSDYTLIAAEAGNIDPPPVPILPKYYAMAIVQWVGYA